MSGWRLPNILQQKWDFGQIFSTLKTTTKPTVNQHNSSVTHDESEINKIRSEEWDLYKNSYFKVKNFLHQASNNYTGRKSKSYTTLSLSDLGKVSGVENISEIILVPENTKLAEMSCVDEATQSGEFIDEVDLDGNPLGTIADPNTTRYMIDLPGSGALAYECEKTDEVESDHDKLVILENEKLDNVAKRVVKWAKKRGIIKFTVTYHCGCGAVNRRLKRHPDICSGSELETAKQCAMLTARKIRLKALEIDYNLEVTSAFVGDKQMCKLRPMSLHNAVGTIGCLDSRVLAYKLDNLVHANFFDVFIFSDFKLKDESTEFVDEIVAEAVRNIKLTYHIATGSHGWGKERFTDKQGTRYPVVLFANGDEQEAEGSRVFRALEDSLDNEEVAKLAFFLVRTDI